MSRWNVDLPNLSYIHSANYSFYNPRILILESWRRWSSWCCLDIPIIHSSLVSFSFCIPIVELAMALRNDPIENYVNLPYSFEKVLFPSINSISKFCWLVHHRRSSHSISSDLFLPIHSFLKIFHHHDCPSGLVLQRCILYWIRFFSIRQPEISKDWQWQLFLCADIPHWRTALFEDTRHWRRFIHIWQNGHFWWSFLFQTRRGGRLFEIV